MISEPLAHVRAFWPSAAAATDDLRAFACCCKVWRAGIVATNGYFRITTDDLGVDLR
jgi:hypothetical protein